MGGKFGAGIPCTGGRVYLREVTTTAGYSVQIRESPADVDAVCEDVGGGCAEAQGCYPVVKLWVQNSTGNDANVKFSRSGHPDVLISLPGGEAVTYVTSDWFTPGTRYATDTDHGRVEVFEDSAPSTHVTDVYLSCSACSNF